MIFTSIIRLFFFSILLLECYSDEYQENRHRNRHRRSHHSSSNKPYSRPTSFGDTSFLTDNFAIRDDTPTRTISDINTARGRNVYGYALPAFSYDFSSLILGAMIERQYDSDDLYLAIFIANLKLLLHDKSLVHALSTDASIIETWTQAAKKLEDPAIGQHNIVCLMNSNDTRNRHSYNVHAQKVITQSLDRDPWFDVYRCKLRGSANIYSTLSKSDGTLHVDIIRKTLKSHHVINESSHIDPRTLLLSFEIPWKQRYTGYGFHRPDITPLSSSNQSPWMTEHKKSAIDSLYMPSTQDNKLYRHALCLGIVQPDHAGRSNIAFPWLLEFITYHLSDKIGYDHIYLGFYLDHKSMEMVQYTTLLSSFIQQDKLSLISLAFENYNDVGGLSSLGLLFKQSSTFVRDLFYNQCLYFSKGMFDTASFMLPNEMYLPLSDSNYINKIYERLYHEKPLNSNTPRVLNSKRSHSQGHSHSFDLQRRNHSIGDDRPVIIPKIETYGIPDPHESFGGWGPGTTTWAKDFFSKSTSIGPFEGREKILFAPTRNSMFIDRSDVIVSTCIRNASTSVKIPSKHASKQSSRSSCPSQAYIVASSQILSSQDAISLMYQGIDPIDIMEIPLKKPINSTHTFYIDSYRRAVLDNLHHDLRKTYPSIRTALKIMLKASITFIRDRGFRAKSLEEIISPFYKVSKPDENLQDMIKNVFNT